MPPPIDPALVQCSVVPLDEVVPLRHQVLRPGLPRETAIFAGDHDASTRHFAALIGTRVVCCASLMTSAWEGEPAWQLRGMATAPELQGTGLGAILLRHIDSFVLAHPPRMLWCNARLAAVGFYQKSGWIVCSDQFIIEDVGPHHKMTKHPAMP